MDDDNLYSILGLAPGAAAAQVERAYRFCLELYGEGSLATYSLLEPAEAEEQRVQVKRAYAVLSDPAKRREYDQQHSYLPPEEAFIPAAEPAANEPELPAEVTGELLRRLREARGLSLRQIAAGTKIGVRFLEYIEADRFAFLPPTVYLRGFLQEYARHVGLDPRQVSERYMRRVPPRS